MEANAHVGPDTISLSTGQTYVLTIPGKTDNAGLTGDLDVTDNVTITGDATIDANDLDRVFDVRSGRLSMQSVKVVDGQANDGGGIRVANGAGLSLVSVEVRDNNGLAGGGGIHGGAASIAMVSTAVTQNSGALAGGIYTSGSLTAQNVTISSNTSTGSGAGGLTVAGAAARLDYVTVTANHGTTTGGVAGPATLTAVVIADQTGGSDCALTLASGGYNLDSDATCLDGSGVGDQPGASPGLGPLALNSGSTRNHLPLAGSPLLDVVPTGVASCGTGVGTLDQRLGHRPLDSNGDTVNECEIGAVETGVLTVNDAGDDVDSNPGDGTCQNAAGAPGTCSLRAAIHETNASPTSDVVTITPGVNPTLTRPGPEPTSGDLDVTDDLTINGHGATIDASRLDRAFELAGVTVVMDDITITGGVTGDNGGGIWASASSLSLTDSVVSGNEAYNGGGIAASAGSVVTLQRTDVDGNTANHLGGGVHAHHDGTKVDLVDSNVVGNDATDDGGGVYVFAADVTFTTSLLASNVAGVNGGGLLLWQNTASAIFTNSTISSNQAASGGGIHVLSGQATAQLSTLAGNIGLTEGNAVRRSGGGVTLRGSIVSGASTDCTGSLTSAGYNLGSDTSCSLTQGTDRPNTPPLLGLLGANGGPTDSHLPFADSPALNAIPAGTALLCNGSLPTDQRGQARPSGAACDIGSVEGHSGGPAPSLSLIVNHAGDAVDAMPGDGVCQDQSGAAGACSLRAAIGETNASAGTDLITIGPGVNPVLSRAGTYEDLNSVGDLDVRDPLTIDGNGATVNGAGLDRVLEGHEAAVALVELRLTGGAVPSFDVFTLGLGGGIRQRNAPLTLDRVTVAGNSSTGSGGGIYASDTNLTIRDSLVASNTTQSGGGLYHSGTATVTVVNTTFADNTATSQGGAIYLVANGSHVITRSSIVGNISSGTAGVQRNAGNLDMSGTVLVNSGPNCSNLPNMSAYNLSSDLSCLLWGPGDVENVNPLLGPLANNGGPTFTVLPGAASPAVNAIPFGTAGICDASTPTDQRGLSRPSGSACDMGAVERQPTDP
jgi:predicted outer membrane repeat protein